MIDTQHPRDSFYNKRRRTQTHSFIHSFILYLIFHATFLQLLMRRCMLLGAAECESRMARCRGRQPCQNVFAGRYPLSEPETVALANFVTRHRSTIRLYLTLHCYSQLWLTPWGYTSTPPADNDDLVSRCNHSLWPVSVCPSVSLSVACLDLIR